jgi:ketosteroid isomerase-like protein
MPRAIFLLASVGLAIIAVERSNAQADPATSVPNQEDSDNDLIELRDRMAKAFQARDVDALIKELGPNAIITWQNGTRNVGAEEFRTFYKKMMEGESSVVKEITTTRQLDGTPIFYGDSTAIAHGNIKQDFTFRDGDEFSLESKWTATLIKTDDQWQVISYHVSTDAFNNPMLTTAKRYLITFATVGAVFGFLAGALIMWFVSHSSRRLVSKL